MTTEPARAGSSSAGRRWAHRIAGLPSGRRTKWAVLVFWVIVIALTGSLAGKLMGAEKNDASAYLPASRSRRRRSSSRTTSRRRT